MTPEPWSHRLFAELLEHNVELFAYVPDAGNARLVDLAQQHVRTRAVLLTTEEEGVAFCAGVDLVGKRGALLLQSSGLGNCMNFLTLVKSARFPMLMIISMRGEYGETNAWQYAMGQAVPPLLGTMGIVSFAVSDERDLVPAAQAALAAVFKGGQGAALILSQRFLGAKVL
jgi:sulfopyruvate decarboxylase alpha subunit